MEHKNAGIQVVREHRQCQMLQRTQTTRIKIYENPRRLCVIFALHHGQRANQKHQTDAHAQQERLPDGLRG